MDKLHKELHKLRVNIEKKPNLHVLIKELDDIIGSVERVINDFDKDKIFRHLEFIKSQMEYIRTDANVQRLQHGLKANDKLFEGYLDRVNYSLRNLKEIARRLKIELKEVN